MPDHFHLLVYIPYTRQTALSGQTGGPIMDVDQCSRNLSRKIGTILSSYTQAINKQEARTGSLFQPKTKSKVVDGNDHLMNVYHYIHQNPLRARLVKEIQAWRFSSFPEYYSKSFRLVNQDIAKQFLDLDFDPDKFLENSKVMILDNLVSGYVD